MAKYIVQHRRGTAEQWAAKDTIIPQEGELVIELDSVNSLHKLKIGDGIHTYAELAYLQAGDEIVTQVLSQAKPRIVTVELAETWNLDAEGKYSQTITLDGITQRSRLDLQPSADMIAEFKQLGLIFVTENNGGTIVVYSVGNMPLKSYTMQATIVETECDGEDIPIVGVPVGIPKDKVAKEDLDSELQAEISNKANTTDLATVAITGSYNDLKDKPETDFEKEIKGQASGNPIRIDDASPLEHEIKVLGLGIGEFICSCINSSQAEFENDKGVYEISAIKPPVFVNYGDEESPDWQLEECGELHFTDGSFYVDEAEEIYPIEQWNTFSIGEKMYFSGWDEDGSLYRSALNGATVTRYGKNLFNTLNYRVIGKPDIIEVAENKVEANVTFNDCLVYDFRDLVPNAKYTLNGKNNSATALFFFVTDVRGNWQTCNYFPYTITANNEGFISIQVRNTADTQREYNVTDIQLEYGTKATEYEPFVEPTIHTADENGNIEIPSIYPTTTLISNDAESLEASYLKNINEALGIMPNDDPDFALVVGSQIKDFVKKDEIDIEVDTELSTTSENPVQNKVITTKLDNKADKSELNNKMDKNPDEIIVGNDFVTLGVKDEYEGTISLGEVDGYYHVEMSPTGGIKYTNSEYESEGTTVELQKTWKELLEPSLKGGNIKGQANGALNVSIADASPAEHEMNVSLFTETDSLISLGPGDNYWDNENGSWYDVPYGTYKISTIGEAEWNTDSEHWYTYITFEEAAIPGYGIYDWPSYDDDGNVIIGDPPVYDIQPGDYMVYGYSYEEEVYFKRKITTPKILIKSSNLNGEFSQPDVYDTEDISIGFHKIVRMESGEDGGSGDIYLEDGSSFHCDWSPSYSHIDSWLYYDGIGNRDIEDEQYEVPLFYDGILTDPSDVNVEVTGANVFDYETFLTTKQWQKQTDGSWYNNGRTINETIWTNTNKIPGSMYLSANMKVENGTPTYFFVYYTDGTRAVALSTGELSQRNVFETLTFTTPANKIVDYIVWTYGNSGYVYIKDLMLSFHNLEYVPYQSATYTSDENGKVNIKSFYPVTNINVDTIIDVEYVKNVNELLKITPDNDPNYTILTGASLNSLQVEEATRAIADEQGRNIVDTYATKDEIASAGNGDMLKSVYDTNNNGIVDKAEDANKLGGKAASEYTVPAHVKNITQGNIESWNNKLDAGNPDWYPLRTEENDAGTVLCNETYEGAAGSITKMGPDFFSLGNYDDEHFKMQVDRGTEDGFYVTGSGYAKEAFQKFLGIPELGQAMIFIGSTDTVIFDGSESDEITVNGKTVSAAAGNVVLYGGYEYVWTGSQWEQLGQEGSFKIKQTAVSSPAANGDASAFIDTISQDANGVITVTKKNVAAAKYLTSEDVITMDTNGDGKKLVSEFKEALRVWVNSHAAKVGSFAVYYGNISSIVSGWNSETATISGGSTCIVTIEAKGFSKYALVRLASYEATQAYAVLYNDAWQDIQVVANAKKYLPLSGGTVSSTSTTTPLRLQAKDSNRAYIGFNGSDGTDLGLIGIRDGAPQFYDGTLHEIITSASIGSQSVASATKATQDGNGNIITSTYATKTELNDKAASSHNHAASNITSGTLSSDRLPTVPVAKGGTGATTAAGALTNLGLTATAAELNIMDGVTATASEINKLDGLTATTTELNYVDGVTSNIQTQLNGKAASSHTHTTVNGVYTQNGGAQPPSYVGSGKVHFNMMNKLTGLSALPTYADLILMDTYTGSDVPYVTAIGVAKTSTPKAYIAVGAKGDTTTWLKQAELISTDNIGSQSVNYATSAGSVAWTNVSGKPSASTSAAGIVQLSSATNSTSTTLAATASAVKSAYDLANNKSTVSFSRSLTSGTKIGTITINGTGTDIYAPVGGATSLLTGSNGNTWIYAGAGGIQLGTESGYAHADIGIAGATFAHDDNGHAVIISNEGVIRIESWGETVFQISDGEVVGNEDTRQAFRSWLGI